MAATAYGLIIPEGREPALYTSTLLPPCMRANASAIWLRLEFSMQTNKILFIDIFISPLKIFGSNLYVLDIKKGVCYTGYCLNETAVHGI